MSESMIIDLFGGCGGWSEGLRTLGLDDHGVELDADACGSRHAAGHATTRADVASLDPALFPVGTALLASPPCQLFSAAGNREGASVIEILAEAIGDQFRRADTRPAVRSRIADLFERPDDGDGQLALSFDNVPTLVRVEAERLAYQAALVVEPARWIETLRPRWVALEQVPAVLPLWEATAAGLDALGYSTWTGILNAADYGVPQTRRRAFLTASLDVAAVPPPPTHSKDGANGRRLWVTMAEALGWEPEEQRALNTGRDWKPGGLRCDAQVVGPGRPAPAFTAKAGGQWQWVHSRPATTLMGDSRIWPPGHKINADDRRRLGDEEAAARYGDRAGTDAIRLEVDQALALQSFRPDYPVQGTRGSRFLQIGNAVPPLLARHIVASLQADLHIRG